MSWKSFFSVVLSSVIVGVICFNVGSGYGEKVGEEKNKDKIYTSEEYTEAVNAAWIDGYNLCNNNHKALQYDNAGNNDLFYDEDAEYTAARFLDYYGSYFLIDSDAHEQLNDAVHYLDHALENLDTSDHYSTTDSDIFHAQNCIYDVIAMISDYSCYYPYE